MNFWWRFWTNTVYLSSVLGFVTDFFLPETQSNPSAAHIEDCEMRTVIVLCKYASMKYSKIIEVGRRPCTDLYTYT